LVGYRPFTGPAVPGALVPTALLKVPDSFHRATQAINAEQASKRLSPTFVRPPPTSRPVYGFLASVNFRQVTLPGQHVPLPGATPSMMASGSYKSARIQTAHQPAVGVNSATEPRTVSILSTDYLLSYPENAWRMISAPVNFDTNDWLVAGGVAAATGLLMLADKEINDTWRDDIHSGTLDDVLDVMEHFGDSQTVLITAGAGYVLGELVGTERDKEAALLVAQSFLLSAGLTQGFKMGFRRDRPDDSRDDQFSFFSPDASKTNSAFPSGHATNAFSMAAFLTNVYEQNAPWLGWLLYPLATMTSLARVNNERHWASDVVFGGALGYFIGRMVLHHSPFRNNDTISLVLLSDGGYNGLKIVQKI
jgi:membrane-associated phospholipid phosphatase